MVVPNAYDAIDGLFADINIDTMTSDEAYHTFGILFLGIMDLLEQPTIPGLTSDFWREKVDVLVGLLGKWGYDGQPGQYRDEAHARDRMTRHVNHGLGRAGRDTEIIPRD